MTRLIYFWKELKPGTWGREYVESPSVPEATFRSYMSQQKPDRQLTDNPFIPYIACTPIGQMAMQWCKEHGQALPQRT